MEVSRSHMILLYRTAPPTTNDATKSRLFSLTRAPAPPDKCTRLSASEANPTTRSTVSTMQIEICVTLLSLLHLTYVGWKQHDSVTAKET